MSGKKGDTKGKSEAWTRLVGSMIHVLCCVSCCITDRFVTVVMHRSQYACASSALTCLFVVVCRGWVVL